MTTESIHVQHIHRILHQMHQHRCDFMAKAQETRAQIIRKDVEPFQTIQLLFQTLVLSSHCSEDTDLLNFSIRLDYALLNERSISVHDYAAAFFQFYKRRSSLANRQRALHTLMNDYLHATFERDLAYHVHEIEVTQQQLSKLLITFPELTQEQRATYRDTYLDSFIHLRGPSIRPLQAIISRSIQASTQPHIRERINHTLRSYADTYQQVAKALVEGFGYSETDVPLKVPVLEEPPEEIPQPCSQEIAAFCEALFENQKPPQIPPLQEELQEDALEKMIHYSLLRERFHALSIACPAATHLRHPGDAFPHETPEFVAVRADLLAAQVFHQLPLHYILNQHRELFRLSAMNLAIIKPLFTAICSAQSQALHNELSASVAQATRVADKISSAFLRAREPIPLHIQQPLDLLISSAKKQLASINAPALSAEEEENPIEILEESLQEYTLYGTQCCAWVQKASDIATKTYDVTREDLNTARLYLISNPITEQDAELHQFYVATCQYLESHASVPEEHFDLYHTPLLIHTAEGLRLMNTLSSMVEAEEEPEEKSHLDNLRNTFRVALLSNLPITPLQTEQTLQLISTALAHLTQCIHRKIELIHKEQLMIQALDGVTLSKE